MPGPIIASEPSFACFCPHCGRHGAARPPRLGAPAGGRRDRPGDTPQPGVLEPVRVRAGAEHNTLIQPGYEPCCNLAPATSRARARGRDRPPEPVPRCGSVGYDPGGSSVLLQQPAAAVRAPQRVLLRSVVTRRSSSTVAPRRPLENSPPPRARTVRMTPLVRLPCPPTTRTPRTNVVRQPAASNAAASACGKDSSLTTGW